MKKSISASGILLILVLAMPVIGIGQEHGVPRSHAGEERESHAESPWAPLWRWGNFILLFGGLGWYFRKPLLDFLAARSEAIREGLANAQQAKLKADLKSAEIDKRLACLDQEVRDLKVQATGEAEEERKRIVEDAQLEARKIMDLARREIEGLSKSARLELKGYVAELAVRLAEERLKAEVGPEDHKKMVEQFLLSLDSGKN